MASSGEKFTVPPTLPAPPRPGGLRIFHLLAAVIIAALVLWSLMGLAASNAAQGIVVVVLCMPVGGGALAVAALVIWNRGRRAQRDALLWGLAIAAERGMPLSATFEAFAEQSGVWLRYRIRVLLEWLREGASLSSSLGRIRGILPADAEVLVRVGDELGVLPGALREAVDYRRAPTPSWSAVLGRFTYLLGTFVVMQTVVSFLVYFITPKYGAILNDFGLPLPGATVFLLGLTHLLEGVGPLLLLAYLAELGLLVFVPLASIKWMTVRFPVVDRLFRRRHSALILRALAVVVDGDRPLGAGFASLAANYPTRWIRNKLKGVAAEVERGEDWCMALRRARLINNADRALLDSARRAGNLPWALRQTAESAERRLGYLLQAWAQVLMPLLVVGIGFGVFVVAMAYFSPLIQLIEAFD